MQALRDQPRGRGNIEQDDHSMQDRSSRTLMGHEHNEGRVEGTQEAGDSLPNPSLLVSSRQMTRAIATTCQPCQARHMGDLDVWFQGRGGGRKRRVSADAAHAAHAVHAPRAPSSLRPLFGPPPDWSLVVATPSSANHEVKPAQPPPIGRVRSVSSWSGRYRSEYTFCSALL